MTNDAKVLVVGAGPVGLTAALRLQENGVPVTIIDQEPRIAGHSYACALHPHSLELLDELGLGAKVLLSGRSLHGLAFYDPNARRAELEFTNLPVAFPCILVIPQNTLEDFLERELAEQGVHVQWNHRLSGLRTKGNSMVAAIDKLVEPDAEYLVPEGTRAIQDKREEEFLYVIGADGQDSFVRESLQIELKSWGPGEAFVVYEFATDAELPHEARVVLEEKTTNVMWPLSDNRCRWSFQLSPAQPSGERRDAPPVMTDRAETEKALVSHARGLLEQRAPWFQGAITEIEWWVGVYFERRLAIRFGQDRCWLVGDAAHRTSPVGVQSLNLGLKEAVHLADAIARILREKGPAQLLEDYDAVHRREWASLIKPGSVEAVRSLNSWAAKHRDDILPCIPASGHELDLLLERLGLRLNLAAGGHAVSPRTSTAA